MMKELFVHTFPGWPILGVPPPPTADPPAPIPSTSRVVEMIYSEDDFEDGVVLVFNICIWFLTI